MKSNFTFLFFTLFAISNMIYGQGPTLNLVGSDKTFSKGTIDTEVLTAIIQQKQEELREKVFMDVVINNFKKASPSVRNFSTYYYIYNVMQTITTEKNKTIITRDLLQTTSEFALVYGFTTYSVAAGIKNHSNESQFYSDLNLVFPSQGTKKENLKLYGQESVSTINSFDVKKIESTIKKDGTVEKPNLLEGKIFNFLIDMTFDALINHPDIIESKLFKDDFNSKELSIWYNADNEYQKIIKAGGTKASAAKNLRAEMDKIITAFMTNYDNFQRFDEFVKDLKAKEQGLTQMTEEQYLAMRSLIKEAIRIIQLNYDNSVVSKISDFVLDYTIIEYQEDKTKDAKLYVDIESLISALDQHYNSKSRKSSVSSKYWYINPRLFFSIGTNYASFFDSNELSTDNSGNTESLDNLYFASEKIGIKIKFFDMKYTRAFEPGEKFKYRGTQRVWLRPQKQAIVSDMHLILYGSGLLYNLVDLKSNDNFNQAVVGTGIGVTFFNGLSANIGVAVPFTDKNFKSENAYLNIGFDIPIIEYIGALSKKK
ncbi:hypothetical protein [Flavisericum labens]|uniref:hypothetical protein n=1 Tax=Flavisericum labens TaxID=3377112 RepID=UPI00387B4003